MKRIHLAAGIAEVGGRVLLVASRYPNHADPLWNLPGGRQAHGELLPETAIREIREETGLRARVVELAYLAESYDGDEHFLCTVFRVAVEGTIAPAGEGDHVVAVEWVPVAELPARLSVGVVREPLVAYLRHMLPQRYAGYESAGITIRWPTDSEV